MERTVEQSARFNGIKPPPMWRRSRSDADGKFVKNIVFCMKEIETTGVSRIVTQADVLT